VTAPKAVPLIKRTYASKTLPSSSSINTGIDIPSPHIPLPDNAKTITLPDGRKLGYAEYGDPRGCPFLFVHGIPDCRLDCAPSKKDKEIAMRLGIRWIGIDRPGIGLSTPDPNRTILDWPKDLQHLIDHLKLDSYHVFGVSGGTSYALACAKLLPRQKLRSVGIMCGMGPPDSGTKGLSLINRVFLTIWRRFPFIMETYTNRVIVPKAQDPDRSKMEEIFRSQVKYAPKGDKEFWGSEETVQFVTDIWREVYRQGSAAGHTQEIKLVGEDWGFELESVTHGNVKFWYGTEDLNTPLAQGKYMADRIPGATLKVYEGRSHFTIGDDIEEMLASMLQES